VSRRGSVGGGELVSKVWTLRDGGYDAGKKCGWDRRTDFGGIRRGINCSWGQGRTDGRVEILLLVVAGIGGAFYFDERTMQEVELV
jgi:hypothetical protein